MKKNKGPRFILEEEPIAIDYEAPIVMKIKGYVIRSVLKLFHRKDYEMINGKLIEKKRS
jgi:hypothetical protein